MKRTAIISFMFLAILSLSGCSLLIDGTHGRTYVSTGTWVDCYNCGYTEYYVSPQLRLDQVCTVHLLQNIGMARTIQNLILKTVVIDHQSKVLKQEIIVHQCNIVVEEGDRNNHLYS